MSPSNILKGDTDTVIQEKGNMLKPVGSSYAVYVYGMP